MTRNEPVVALGQVPVAVREGPTQEVIISGSQGSFASRAELKVRS